MTNDRVLKEWVARIVKLLKKEYPEAKTALHHKNPLELLVATILSAQCTDKRVNMVTKVLFQKYKTAEDYAKADLTTFEQEIHSTGFYRNKAKNIKATCTILAQKYGGKVPADMNVLLELPGVARKTANVVLGSAFGIAEGVVVDTHVHRLAQRLGLSDKKDAGKVEDDLMTIVPKSEWILFPHMLIWHGRKVCQARKPNCEICVLKKECPSAGKV